MRHIVLFLVLALMLAVVIVVPALASTGGTASGGKACVAPGTNTAVNNVQGANHSFPGYTGTSTAYSNIPNKVGGPDTGC
jgi:hypothetical protein